jgi:hypothetical protein
VILAAPLAVLLPSAAAACAVCVSGTEANRAAFFGTTVFLSLLPLGIIGAGLYWLWRRGRQRLAWEFEERDVPAPLEPAAGPPPRA